MEIAEDTCCCGHRYSEPGRGKSDHRCPTGRRMLCQECVTNGKGQRCPPHGAATKW